MNEIDPASNGSITTTDQEPTSSANHTSPLLSSLLSNGQQQQNNSHHNHGVMPTNTTNDTTNNSNAFMTNNSRRSDDLTINNHRKYSNSLSDLLQRNNNNNKVPPSSDDEPAASPSPSTKSILENCLMKPSLLKSTYQQSQSESHVMESHHHHSPTTSSVLKYAASSSEDNRKVEPIKINLNREPIRTVIKLPPQNDTDTPPSVIKSSLNNSTVSPTLSSSSHSSESSYDNCNSASNDGNRLSAIQVIPKLHIRTLLNPDSASLNHDTTEPHIVPKLKITGLASPPHEQREVKDYSNVNSNIESSPAIPKITIKKDNNDYHLNNDNAIPRLHIKTTNHHHHHHHGKESVPKIMVSKIIDSQDTIPKLTLKVNNSSASPTFERVVPKLKVKIPKELEPEQIESSSCSPTPSPPSSPIVSKLNIKPIPPPPSTDKEVPKTVKNCVDAASPPSDMKFSINRLIASSEKKNADEPLEINTTTHIKNADSGLDSPRIILKINKTNNESITSEIVPQPTTEIVQKSASTNASSNHKRPHSNEPSADALPPEIVNKKPKLDANSDELIIINDSDTSSSDNVSQKNHKADHQPNDKPELPEAPVQEVAKTTRSLRQRRNHEAKKEPPQKPVAMDIDSNNSKENSLPETEHLALSNDATSNTNSLDDSTAPTPKRGRGRPKKIVSEKVSIVNEDSMKSQDQIEPQTPVAIVDLSQDAQSPLPDTPSEVVGDESNSSKRTPAGRGRGRGRGRGKRVVEVVKNGKPVQITLEGHDDDDSPSFSLYNRGAKGNFNNSVKKPKSARGRGRGRGSATGSTFLTPEKLKESTFTTPEQSNRRKLFNTPSIFEEDTRMSIGGDSSSQTPMKSTEMFANEESQSSQMSSASNTVEGSTSRKRTKKMEVCEPEGRIEFTVDLLTEYDWPQNEPPSNRESYMIQEQICEYLGVKSFKRKYPDLHRRPVDMEERNYLFENGLASEKMCDLGLTALYASEVLDIMCNDYPEKYEEYKRYQREKAFQFARQRFETAIVDRSQMQKDKAISSASEWNSRFNKDRKENRRSCMDLQNFLIQKPSTIRKIYPEPSIRHRSHYPVSVVPGQFSEYYEKLSPLQLACYPLNTILVDRTKLDNYLATHSNAYESSDDSDDSDTEGGSSSSDSDSTSGSESSSDDDYEDPKCLVCSKTPFQNQFDKPEKFVKCSKCKNQSHPSCIEMSVRMYQRTLAYPWQCSNCKSCCKCHKAKDNKMLYCVQCDRGFHIYCLGLRNVPEGQYHCDNCKICSECGCKSPEGHFNPTLTPQQRQDLAMIAQWNHEFVDNPLTKIREHVASYCLPCFRKSKKDPKDESANKAE